MGHKPSKLLRFIDFLAKSVRCENLELLTRIVTEFQDEPQSFSTVESMVRLGFPMVTILPETELDAGEGGQASEEAVDLRHDGDDDDLMELYRALEHKIVLHNWDWLLEIYADYCAGHNSTLQTFVSLRRQAISVVPATPCTPIPQTCTSKENDANQRVPVPQSLQENIPKQVERRLKRKKAWTHHLAKITDVEQDLLDVINTMNHSIERQKPWKQIFDVSKIVYPFDASKHPSIARALLQFWTRHARAVWERNFWCRFPQHPPTAEYDLRKNRQREASRAFEATVIAPLFNELGGDFFVDMDERADPHHWWWYRGPLVDLVCIATMHDLRACLKYQKTQARVRFPVVPDKGRFRTYLHKHDQGASMWSTMVGSQHIAAAIKALKTDRSISK